MIEWFGNIGQVLPSPYRKTVMFSPPMMTSHVSNTNKKRYSDKVSKNMGGVNKSTDDAMIVRDIIASRKGRRTTHNAIDTDYNNMLAGTESYRDTRANRQVHRRAILLGQKLYNADDLARLSLRSSRWSKDQAQLRANCRWM